MLYLIRIYRYGGNYSAMVPDLPGCIAAADSIEETISLMAEAIALHLSAMRRHGEKIPNPTKRFDLNVDDFEDEELCTWIEPREPQNTRTPKKRKKTLSSK
jgi:predicted RNase H-like HicB family nuclease